MATFTMELREVLEHVYGDGIDPDDYVQQYDSFTFNGVTYGKLPVLSDPTLIGLGTYPLFSEEYRPILNGKIIDEFFTQEIATETIDNWTLMIRRKMDQIMPYFNKLYESEKIPYNALDTMMIHSVSKAKEINVETAEATNDNTSINKGKARAVQSNTPQTMLAGNEDYATSASDTNSDGTVTGNSKQDTKSNTTGDTESDNLVTGYQGIASDLISKYRATLLNVDTSILVELQDCFMMLLNNGDEYTRNNYAYGWIY